MTDLLEAPAKEWRLEPEEPIPQELLDTVQVTHLGPVWEENPNWNGVNRLGPQGKYILPEFSLGYQAWAWVRENLNAPDASDDEPMPFEPTFEQYRFVLWWYAVDERGRFLFRRGVFQRLKGHGKDPLAAVISAIELLGPCRFKGWATKDLPQYGLDPQGKPVVRRGLPVAVENPTAWVQIAAVTKTQPLALDTPVRTINGWSTMGELKVGDAVFGSDGQPVPVARETEVMHGLKCYEVSFSDGEKITASASHGWTVEGRNGHDDGFVKETLSTEELAERWNKKRWRFRVPIVPIVTGKRDLPLDPYMLGLWLGDGSTADSTIAIDWRLRDEIESIVQPHVAPHEEIVWAQHKGNSGTFRVRTRQYVCPRGHDYADDYYIQSGNRVCRTCFRLGKKGRAEVATIPTFREKLRNIGVLGDKHIPDGYFQAGNDQRLALLQGLMDSDGGITPGGRANFTNKNPELIEGICELLSSLGIRWNVQLADGGAQRVYFTPWAALNPFRLGYKRERVQKERRYAHRSIVGVREVESVPVKCIGIDTDDHLFQVGYSGILTHNTQNTMLLFPALFNQKCREKAHMRNDSIGATKVTAFRGRRQIQAVTSNPRALEGGRPSLVIKNETEHWIETNNGWAMDKAIDRNAAKSRKGAARSLAICNAPEPSEESVGLKERNAYLREVEGTAFKTGVLYDSLELAESVTLYPPGIDHLEPEFQEPLVYEWIEYAIKKVRGDSWWLDPERIAADILDTKDSDNGGLSEARRFFFNQTIAAEDAWVLPQAVDLAVDPLVGALRTRTADVIRIGWEPVRPDEPIVMFFDGSKSDDATALIGCRLSDGYTFTIGIWQAPPGRRRRGKNSWLAPRGEVDTRVDEAFERFTVVAFWADPSHAKDDEDGAGYWDGLIDEWHRLHKHQLLHWSTKTGAEQHSILWDMSSPQRTKMFVAAAERTVAEFEHRDENNDIAPTFSIDGNPRLMEHMKNAKMAPSNFGVGLRKEGRESLRKIDAAVCLVGARLLRRIVLNAEPEEEEQKGGWAWAD